MSAIPESALLLVAILACEAALCEEPPKPGENPPDVPAILAKVRDKLQHAKSYRFERQTTIREAKVRGESTPVADLTFITIADFSAEELKNREMPKSPSAAPLPAPFLEGRFRFELKTVKGDFLQVGDGTNAWFSSSAHKMYRRGDTLWSLSESIMGPVLANAHIFPFQALSKGAAKDAKFVREEEIECGKERRACIVITAGVPNPDLAGMMGKALAQQGKSAERAAQNLEKETPQAFIGVSWNLSMLNAFGYLGNQMLPRFTASAAKEKQFTDVTLWIDKERSLLLRAEFREAAQKVADPMVPSAPGSEVELRVTEQFTVAEIDMKLKDDLFTFVPSKDAKEVGKIGDGGGGPIESDLVNGTLL
ncbi:MAG: hypothetical protein K8R36_12035 [Planctomycetales bacterium]|nr:hypothetical protein [Planctomycetales bacterium]